jgi:hypothetical protein
MAKFIGNIKASLGLDTGNFSKNIGKAKTEMNGFEKATKSFTTNIGGMIAGAFAVDAILTFGKEASDLAGKLTGVEAAFKKIDNGGLLKNLQKATKGTVSDLELMQNAVKAENLGLPVEQLGTYFEFARRTAKATGESVEFLVQSIVTGIGRKSPLILDNLGISTTQLNEQLKKTPDFATAVGVVIAEKMAKAGEDVDTAAERSAQFAAVWQNFKTGVGTAINDAVSSIVQSFADLWDVLSQLFAPIGELLGAFDSMNGEFSIGAMLGDLLTLSIKALTFMLKPMVWIVQKVAEGFKYLYENSEFFRQAVEIIRGSINAITKVFGNLGAVMSAIGNSFSHLWTAIKTMDFDGLGGKISGEFKKAFETKPVEKQAEAIKVVTKETKTLTTEQIKAIEAQKKLNKLREGLDFSVSAVGTKGLTLKKEDLPAFQLMEGIDKLPSVYEQAMATLQAKIDKTTDAIKGSAQAINDAFYNIITGGLAAFGAALGTAFAGGDVMAIGQQFAGLIADSIGGLGQKLIELGVVMSGIMETLSTVGWSNPALLIGGGIALVALSQAMKGMMSSPVAFANGGLVTGATMGLVGEGRGTTRSNPEVIAPLDKLQNFMPQSSGGGGAYEFIIKGDTLVASLNRNTKTQKYSR